MKLKLWQQVIVATLRIFSTAFLSLFFRCPLLLCLSDDRFAWCCSERVDPFICKWGMMNMNADLANNMCTMQVMWPSLDVAWLVWDAKHPLFGGESV